MSGNKGPMKKPNGKPTPKALALRRWNCESVEQMAQLIESAQREIIEEKIKQRLDPKCWKGKHKEGTKIKGGVRVNNCVPNEGVAEAMSQRNRDQGAIGHGLPWKRYDDLDQLAQDISDKILTITNIVKLNNMAHDSTIYNALERYFKKYGYPDNVFNRVASIVFKKLDDEGRRMTTDPRVAEEWTQKYKSSINCSNPKGFSQKAHCAGKKK
jgi:hypothetical protein